MVITIIVCVVLVAIDRVLKILAVNYLAPVGTIEVFPGFAGLRYIENNGAAFSILAGKQGILIAVTSVVLVVLGYIIFVRRPASRGFIIGLSLVFAGGVGNLIDRIAYRYVVDYIEFLFMDFAIFNFADILVTFGFVILIIALIYDEVTAHKKRKALEAEGQDEPHEPAD